MVENALFARQTPLLSLKYYPPFPYRLYKSMELPEFIAQLDREAGMFSDEPRRELVIRKTHAPLAARFHEAVSHHRQRPFRIFKVIWYLSCDQQVGECVDAFSRVLENAACCHVQHLDVVADHGQTFTSPNGRLYTSFRRLTKIKGLETMALHGAAFGCASPALQGFLDGLCSSQVTSVTWAPSSPLTLDDDNPTDSFANLATALCDMHWQGSLLVSSSLDAGAWEGLVRLIQNSSLFHLDLHITGVSSQAKPPDTLTNALRQNVQLQSLAICGTDVFECLDVLPDDLTEILWRNRLLAAVRTTRLRATSSHVLPVAWLAGQLVQRTASDARVHVSPLYTLIRDHYVRPGST